MEDIELQTSSPDLTITYLKLATFYVEAQQMRITDHSSRFAQVKVTDGRALLYPEIKPDQIVGFYPSLWGCYVMWCDGVNITQIYTLYGVGYLIYVHFILHFSSLLRFHLKSRVKIENVSLSFCHVELNNK